MIKSVLLRLLIFLGFGLGFSQAQLCTAWSETEIMGYLDPQYLAEASGISQSLDFPERFYQVNDSARSFQVFLTDETGRVNSSFDLGIPLRDVEDSDVGNCGLANCLVLGDIGDNLRQRDTIALYLIPEQESYASNPQFKKINLRYPDGSYDAESLAVRPDGSLYLLTKASFNLLRTEAARLYRLPKPIADLQDNETLTLEYVLSLDIYALSGVSFDFLSHLATSMDFSPDGKKLLILTYGDAFELEFERLLAGDLKVNKIVMDRSLQQEAITYVASDAFIYTAEARADAPPVKKRRCLNP